MKSGSVVLLLLAAGGAGWMYYFGRHHLDAYLMNDVVGTSARTWESFGAVRARQKLDEELRRRNLPGYITPEQCTFAEEPGDVKLVDCAWSVDVYLPFVAEGRRLRFRVAKAVNPDGSLEDR